MKHMSQQSSSSTEIIIQLEIIPEDILQQDLAGTDEAGQSIINYLEENGSMIKPTYTGRMGGPVYDIMIHTYHIIEENKDLLTAMFASVATTLKLISEHNKRMENKNKLLVPTPTPIEIILPAKDDPLTIKAPNAETALKILEQIKDTQPEEVKKVTTQSKAKIKVSIPKQKWIRRL